MKKRNREISIFGMSALDLFASALGAFILITVVLFPYFPNIASSPAESTATQDQQQLQDCQSDLAQVRANLVQTRANLAQTLAELQESQASLREAQSGLTQDQLALQDTQESIQKAQENLQQCTKELRKKFLMVLMSWKGIGDDVDLYVHDPQGNLFHFNRKTNPGTLAKFEEDNTNGPGNEIWLHPQATPGKYEICYNFFRSLNYPKSVAVRGAYLTPDGRRDIGTVIMSPPAGRGAASTMHVANILIDGQGNATLQPGSRGGICGVTFVRVRK